LSAKAPRFPIDFNFLRDQKGQQILPHPKILLAAAYTSDKNESI